MEQTAVNRKEKTGIDKTAIKKFAVYSRNKLMNDIKNKAALIGITESGIQKPLSTSTGNVQFFDIGMTNPYQIEGKAINQRNELIRELDRRKQGSTYKTAYETLIEEVAYTWFNRIIAIRFMEVNNYMPNRLRVLSSGVSGINEPELITHVFESGLEFAEKEQEWIIEKKSDGSNIAMDELFQYLFIKQCNALNANLPNLFEKTNDYSELLLTVSYNDIEGVIYKLVHDVSESDFDVNSEDGNGQVEIIGWLYQFYNTEPKATVFGRSKSKKIEKQDIPAATQLFTPEWIVRYMVENTLGRLWIEKLLANGDSRSEEKIANDFGWRYYLPESEQTEEVKQQINLIRDERKALSVEDITFLDPAAGSFHIGVYAFEIFMQIYESEGYTKREASRLIIEKNIHGLDIDKRAAQLSYFTIMMQARKYNRRALDISIISNVYEITDSNHINRSHIEYLGDNIEDREIKNELKRQLISLLNIFNDAKEYGSLLNVSGKYDFKQLKSYINSNSKGEQISLLDTIDLEFTQKELLQIIDVAEISSRKYQIVITNPPYMSSSGMDTKLSKFAKTYYPDSKSDMFAMFIERCSEFTVKNGYFSMITQHAWMFLSSYERLRTYLLDKTLVNMAHLGTKAFEEIGGEVVQTTAFVFTENYYDKFKGCYIDLTKTDTFESKEELFLRGRVMRDENVFFYKSQKDFNKIPGSPIAYWASEELLDVFQHNNLEKVANVPKGLSTGSVGLFTKLWFEVDWRKIDLDHGYNSPYKKNKKWYPYLKGGEYRKWHGNYEYVVNWEDDGYEIKNFKDDRGKVRSRPQNIGYYFKEGLTYSAISSKNFAVRYMNKSIFGGGGDSIQTKGNVSIEYLAGFLNSKVADYILKTISPTLNVEVDHIKKLPIITNNQNENLIKELVQRNIYLSKQDWDDYETSWYFKSHPLISGVQKLEQAYNEWKIEKNERFLEVQANENKLNSLFIEMYKLSHELESGVSDNSITLTDINVSKDIQSLISYGIGCIFGRYSLDNVGVINAGGEWKNQDFKSYLPIKANIVPIISGEYLSQGIVELFCDWLEKAFGLDVLEENLMYISNFLGNKGNTPREKLLLYFQNDFFKHHKKTYSSRPIYWLYDSGKQNGFKALVYLHRYDADTTGKVRVEYLHQVQRAYERTIVNLQEDIGHTNDAKEITQIQKSIEKLTKQLKECREYDEHLGHMALERVAIDLDDGVKVNYEKVQTDSKGKFHQILAKI